MYEVVLNGVCYQSADPRAIAVEMACHFAPMAVGVEWSAAGDALKSAGMNGTQAVTVQTILDVVLIAARRQWNSLDHIQLSFHNRPAAMRREATACAVSRFDANGNRRAGYSLRQVKKMYGGKLPARVFINSEGQYVPFTDDVLTVEIIKAVPACGACGGEGNCPDCMVWDAPLTEVLAETPRDTDAYEALEGAILKAYPAVEVDIVTRLAQAGLSMHSSRPTQTEQEVIAALIAAADEIRALRAEIERLEAMLNPIITVKAATDNGAIIGYRWFVEAPQMVCVREGAKDTHEAAQQAAQDYINSGEIKPLKGE